MDKARIPLFYRGQVYAHALIDAEDFDRLNRWRWLGGPLNRIDPTPGYAQRGSTVSMHRQVMGLGPGDGFFVHHRNGDRIDNRKANLIVCETEFEHLGLLHHGEAA